METIKRPGVNETDEDLLREQELFLKTSKKPAAQTVSSQKSEAASGSQKKDIPQVKESHNGSEQTKLETDFGDVIFDVKERDVPSQPFVFKSQPDAVEEISHLMNKNIKISKFAARKKAQSIFEQMVCSTNDESIRNESNEPEIPTIPVLIDGSGLAPDAQDSEVKNIHEENLAKLSSMSIDEIREHQEQLKNYLKPEILNFIKRKKGMKKDDKSTDSQFQKKSKCTIVDPERIPGEILKKEGNKDCDALILEKVLTAEDNEFVLEEQDHCRSSKTKKEFDLPEETKELVEGTNKGLWKGMNKLEKEKLEWMTDLPQPKPIDLKTGYTARFDFQGKLLSRDTDLPTYEGLHHHGEEPEVPGYSLEELFLLARSSLQSQRITAINTIAHILENNWCGMMDTCFDSPLLPLLLNAGIVPLLRWALDDTSLTSVSATISAIHSLLISKADEACLHQTFCWLNGHFVPQLEPQDLDEPNIVIEELTDADLIKLDVVKGFLRIDLLPRFMYIFKVMCPPPLVCKLIIEICARLAQHSPESALQVAEHPGLLELLLEKFLPLNWHFIDPSTLTDTVNFSCPMHSALKLMRILASTNKDLAINLVEKCGIISIITFYLTIQPIHKSFIPAYDPRHMLSFDEAANPRTIKLEHRNEILFLHDGKLPAQDLQLLVIETVKIWHTFLCYGLASSIFLDLFHIFLQQLDFCLSLDLNCDLSKHVKDLDYASHLFKAFEAVSVVASEQTTDIILAAAVNPIFKKSLVCLKKWLWQFSQESPSTLQMTLLAACMNFIVTHCRKSHDECTCQDWEPCSAAKEVLLKYLVPSLKSKVFQNALKEFRSFSLYLSSDLNGNKRDGKTIVSLGSVLYGKDIVSNLKEGTPLPLLSSILSYVLLYKSFFHDIGNECLELIFCAPVFEYLKALSSKELKTSCWFLKFETFYITQLIELSAFLSNESSIYKEATILSHDTAVSVLPSFSSPEECLVKDLFENILFNQQVFTKMDRVNTTNSLEWYDYHMLLPRLPVIAQCYSSLFLSKEATFRSRNMYFRSTDIDSLFCLSTPNVLICKDWCFMPIFYLHQKARQRKGDEKLTPEESLQVTCCLQWIYMSHLLHIPVIERMPASAEFYYLCLVFLLDEDLFWEDKIKALLTNCLRLILEGKQLNLLKIKWNNIKNFDDLFLDMLIQYEAVSYGDELFGNFLVIPLQQHFRSQWKKILFTEHSSVLSFLRLPLKKVIVPLENFLGPRETDVRLLTEYFNALASGILNHKRCPLLYLVAVKQINNYIFMKLDDHVKSQKFLLTNVLRSKKDLRDKLLLYKRMNPDAEYGFDMSENVSPENEKHLSKLMGAPIVM